VVLYCLQNDVTSGSWTLFRWDVVPLGPEAVFVRNVAYRYGCSIWTDVGIEALLDDHSLPAIICVQQPALFTDSGAIPVREPVSGNSNEVFHLSRLLPNEIT
jgi:hypothetical protein